MGNNISTTNRPKLSTEVNENHFDFFDLVPHTLSEVIHNYVQFLLEITVVIIGKHKNNIEREKRKFQSVRKELFYFLLQHKIFFNFKNIKFSSKNESMSHILTSCSSANFDQFLKLDDFLKLDEKLSILKEISHIRYSIDLVEKEIIKRMKIVLKKSVISNEDIQAFLCKHYLIEKKDVKIKCSNYKELKNYIHNRVQSYSKRTVCYDHIEEVSLYFQGSITDIEKRSRCCVCLEDYEKEVCHLPYNHFCCRNCIEKYFAIL